MSELTKDADERIAVLTAANEELASLNNGYKKKNENLTLENITLKRIESDNLKVRSGLEDNIAEKETMLASARKELESFSYSVSHDLRAPLRAISGNAKILEEDHASQFDPDGLKSLKSIMSNSMKMGHLIDDLLAFSSLLRKQMKTFDIDMDWMVNSIVEKLEPSETRERPLFHIEPLHAAQGDATFLKMAWTNLISNAVKYANPDRRTNIEIGCYEKDKSIIYFIKDNGVGFDMKYYYKLFGVFQRLHSHEEFDGTGMGLAIVQRVINLHGGKVWGESTIGVGSTFYFSLTAGPET